MSVSLTPLYDAATLRDRVAELAADISRAYAGLEITAVIIMNGGVFFAADLLRRIDVPICLDSLDPDERAALLEAGSEICFIPFVPGYSTTGTLKKAAEKGA